MIRETNVAQPANMGTPCLDSETWESTVPNGLKIKITRGKILLSICVSLAAFTGHAQSPLADSSSRTIARGAAVEYLYPEQVTIEAGKPVPVPLHFRIAPGFHINSHTPKEDFLIPTALSIPESSGVTLMGATYPAGADFTLPLDSTTKLSVYTGEFAIQARLVAQRGNHLIQASLHYQACDKTACMPPKTITVPIDVIGQ